MRTVILFSSVFYLLGLKLGHTVDLLKRAAIPVRSVISAPALREDKPDRAYFFKKEGDERKKQKQKRKWSATVSGMLAPLQAKEIRCSRGKDRPGKPGTDLQSKNAGGAFFHRRFA